MICARCNAECERNGSRQKYCPACKTTVARERLRRWREANGDRANAQARLHYSANVETRRAQWRERREKNLESRRAKERLARRKQYAADPETHREHVRRWRKDNAEKHHAQQRERNKRRRADPCYRLHNNISNQIWHALKGRKRGRSWQSLVGYTLDDLKAHLERQFAPRMSWANYGKWHIDHIRPRSQLVFEHENDPAFRECWALTNLRPMWGKANIAKHASREFLI